MISYDPQSPEGQKFQEDIQLVWDSLTTKPAKTVGDWIFEKTENPHLAGSAAAIIGTWPVWLGLRKALKGKGMPTKRKIVENVMEKGGKIDSVLVDEVMKTTERFENKVQGMRNKFEGFFDNEVLFRKIGTPETGFHYKNIPSVIEIYQDKAKILAQKWIKSGANTTELRWADYLRAEEKAAEQTIGSKLIRDGFDEIYKDMKASGYVAEKFPLSYIR